MTFEGARTVHAQQALDISELLTLKFTKSTFGTEVPKKIQITEPDGPSTDGGRKARQSVLLVPVDETQDTTLNVVCGWINAAEKSAEFKSFDVVAKQYHRRHGKKIDLKQDEHEKLLADLRSFLKTQGFETRITTEAPEFTGTTRQAGLAERDRGPMSQFSPEERSSTVVVFLIGFGCGFLLAYLMFGLNSGVAG